MRQDLNGRHWFAGPQLVLGHGLIFAAAGPAIGTLLSPGLFFLPLGLFFSYLTSTPVALLAGLLTGVAALRINDGMHLGTIAPLIGAACGMLVPAYMTVGSWFPSGPGAGLFILYAIDGAFAAAVCTRMTRFLRLRYSAIRT